MLLKNIKKSLLIMSLLFCGYANANGQKIKLVFIGIESEKEKEFIAKLENNIYQELDLISRLEVIGQNRVSHLRAKGLLTKTILSVEEAEELAVTLQCRLVLFVKIQETQITPKRYLYFPIWGYYKTDIKAKVWLYDSENQNFRYDDLLVLPFNQKKGYCGVGNFDRHMTLTALERGKIQNAWVNIATTEIAKRVKLNLRGLYPESVMSAPDTTVIRSDSTLDSTKAADTVNTVPADTAQLKAAADKGTSGGPEEKAITNAAESDETAVEKKEEKTEE